MNIAQAIAAMNDGRVVRRGILPTRWIMLRGATETPIDPKRPLGRLLYPRTKVTRRAYHDIWDGEGLTPWRPSTDDLNATDYEIVPWPDEVAALDAVGL